ncbi:hypothetical protein GCM10017690_15340 [Microbacterium terregens]
MRRRLHSGDQEVGDVRLRVSWDDRRYFEFNHGNSFGTGYVLGWIPFRVYPSGASHDVEREPIARHFRRAPLDGVPPQTPGSLTRATRWGSTPNPRLADARYSMGFHPKPPAR